MDTDWQYDADQLDDIGDILGVKSEQGQAQRLPELYPETIGQSYVTTLQSKWGLFPVKVAAAYSSVKNLVLSAFIAQWHAGNTYVVCAQLQIDATSDVARFPVFVYLSPNAKSSLKDADNTNVSPMFALNSTGNPCSDNQPLLWCADIVTAIYFAATSGKIKPQNKQTETSILAWVRALSIGSASTAVYGICGHFSQQATDVTTLQPMASTKPQVLEDDDDDVFATAPMLHEDDVFKKAPAQKHAAAFLPSEPATKKTVKQKPEHSEAQEKKKKQLSAKRPAPTKPAVVEKPVLQLPVIPEDEDVPEEQHIADNADSSADAFTDAIRKHSPPQAAKKRAPAKRKATDEQNKRPRSTGANAVCNAVNCAVAEALDRVSSSLQDVVQIITAFQQLQSRLLVDQGTNGQ